MPFNAKNKAMVKNRRAKQVQSSLGASGRKAPGTRIGLLFDWRGGSSGTGSDRYGRSLRDGR